MDDLALYIHWPFCRAKCPYCDFNSHVREKIDEKRWQKALLAEMDHFAEKTGARRLTSIFFGGGTPSLMPVELVHVLIMRALDHWHASPDLEITLEANPNSAERESFRNFYQAGVNRLSLGIQSFDDEALKFLGRLHNASEACRALEWAAEIFPRFSFDLIYARPDQELRAWKAELTQALAYRAKHLSLYQLTIETGTVFEQAYARGDFAMPDEDSSLLFFDHTQEEMQKRGLNAYEISNYAVPGEESRHNLTYWRYGDYVGIGPGAHGRLSLAGKRFATRQHRSPEIWLERVEASSHASQAMVELSAAEQWQERLLMGLRLSEGIAMDVAAHPHFQRFLETGFLEERGNHIRASAKGRRVLNALLGELLQ